LKSENIFKIINKLAKNKLFNIKNPNKVRSLYYSFAINNLEKFHSKN
jgi:aminopeptidase N